MLIDASSLIQIKLDTDGSSRLRPTLRESDLCSRKPRDWKKRLFFASGYGKHDPGGFPWSWLSIERRQHVAQGNRLHLVLSF